MNRLFSQESPIIRFLNAFADLVAVNLLMILFSLPVVTLGAAVTAGCRVTRDIANDTVSKIFPSFWGAFRDNFRQATLFWIAHLAVLLGLSYNFYLFQFLLDESHLIATNIIHMELFAPGEDLTLYEVPILTIDILDGELITP